jgi:alkanesulfonate monooxygenase SsuD/methylene tetrahydromethanopterin reductase-like flavin-dependent oxidoreductase (luciferase family)
VSCGTLGGRDGARFDGRFYRLEGARRGPAAAHRIPIWLGAYKPRSLRLVGARADGWLPTPDYLPSLDAIDEGNKRIDDAAREAGRDLADIRRMLNLGPDLTRPDALAHLAADRGVDTFLLMSDDPDLIRRFGQEVAPATRALLEVSDYGREGVLQQAEPRQGLGLLRFRE